MLLHICCAPCLDGLITDENPTLYFYNPNIHPEEEYKKRLVEVRKVAKKFNLSLMEGEYDKDRWLELVKGLEKEPEKGKRCEICFEMRLEETAKKAKELGIKNIATTLVSSVYKDSVLINKIGEAIAQKYNLKFFCLSFDKKGINLKSLKLPKELNLYRQKYCGCIFSKLT